MGEENTKDVKNIKVVVKPSIDKNKDSGNEGNINEMENIEEKEPEIIDFSENSDVTEETKKEEKQIKESEKESDKKNEDKNEKKNTEQDKVDKQKTKISKNIVKTRPKYERKDITPVESIKPNELIILRRLLSDFDTISQELKQLNKKFDTLISANEKPLELEDSIENLTKTMFELRNTINLFTSKLDSFIRQSNIQISRWDMVYSELKKLNSILQMSIEEVNEYIKNPLFEDIEDENALKLAMFLWHNLKLGYSEFPDEVIMSKLGMTPVELKRAKEYLRKKGWNIEEVVYSPEE